MTSTCNVGLKRRQFIRLVLITTAAAVLPMAQLMRSRAALAAQTELPHLDESDPAAKNLGYVQDATKTDTAKFPKRAGPDGASQFCKSCQLYSGSNSGWGPCSIFPGKAVNANGWCNAWIKKGG